MIIKVLIILIIIIYVLKGSALLIMSSKDEPDSFFGAMAVPSWDSNNHWISDPID